MTESLSMATQIENIIKTIEPFDDLEKIHQKDALEWVRSGVNIFRIAKPDKPPKHLVSYFVIIDPIHKSLLLVDHIKAQLWLPTGGHVKVSEHPKQAAVREAQEELNMQAIFLNQNPFFITVNQTGGLTPGHTDVSLWYLLKGNIHEFINFNRTEFNDIEWFTFNEILESDPVIFDRHMPRFARKLQNYLIAR